MVNMTQADFINMFPSEDLKIRSDGNITFSPSSPEAAKMMADNYLKNVATLMSSKSNDLNVMSINPSEVTIILDK